MNSSSSASVAAGDLDEARRQNAVSLLLFFAVSVALLARFFISPQIVNRVMEYTTETGALWEKLHPGTYAILLLLPVVLLSRPIRLVGDEIGKFRALLRYAAAILALTAYLVLTGNAGSAGFFIDTYLMAGAAGLIVLSCPPAVRRAVGGVVLSALLVSALMGIFEAATQRRILPYPLDELTFRPIGLMEHPLTLGLVCTTAIGFVAVTRWRAWVKVAAIFLLLVGVAASGGRFALLLGGLEVLLLLIFVPWPRLSPRAERRAKLGVLILVIAGGTALIGLLLAGGLLSRFSNTLFDENYMARITIYQLFGYMSPRELLLGADVEAMLKIVNDRLELPFIESSPVVFVIIFGVPMTIAFALLLFWIFRRMLRFAGRPAAIATVIFFITALSNNTLSTKTPVVAMVLVLILCFVPPGAVGAAQAKGHPGGGRGPA